jgi:hypothetical protein
MKPVKTLKTKNPKLESIIKFRIRATEKGILKSKAKELGITMTEFIVTSMKGDVVQDRASQKLLYGYLSKLTKEINLIGKNINQATLAIHQIKNSDKMEQGDYDRFNSLLKELNSKEDELKETIKSIIFR